ncbi:MAG TPA: gluconolaconase [Propionibacteriaceae bacterium]|nr:gluconolaconase [Propionibacteriaceae bacterium]
MTSRTATTRTATAPTAATVTAAALALLSAAMGMPAASAEPGRDAGSTGGTPATYTLSGDPGDAAGSKFEGIGVDERREVFYVSETTGGEVHRGHLDEQQTQVWLQGDGTDGRFTARGITVDRQGRVYIAGGPNGIDHPGMPDLWVYDRDGNLLATFDLGDRDAFLNDVAIGPDGAAYFTDSNDPQIFRVAFERGAWTAELWRTAANITRGAGFNLGGIVVAPDRRSLVVAQGNTGDLWRFDLATDAVTRIETGGANLTSADGLVLRGNRLTVIRNFPRVLTTLRLDSDADSAELLREVATDPERVFTTGKVLQGRLLLVDSHFEEPIGQPPYQVVSIPFGRGSRR